MLTTGAVHAIRDELAELTHGPGIIRRRDLTRLGVSTSQVRANLDARRWQRIGAAIVLHSGPLSAEQQALAACFNCGPRAVLTAFTAAALYGLRNWSRPSVHVLVPAGTRSPRWSGLSVTLHRAASWSQVARHSSRPLHQLGPALLLAGATFTKPRPACAILAAAVQQRIVTTGRLREALMGSPQVRHRAAMLRAVDDIALGAQALSEIDFVALCRRHRLPIPEQQTVRPDPSGRRRYLDATWRLQDGRLLVVEVDGAIHLSVDRWQDDQLRQNDIALSGALILRFPSVVVRHEPDLVVCQLRAALASGRA